jgi:alanyl-tRNA synthetase
METTADVLRKKYINYMVSKGHIKIPSAPLIPENNPSLLFVNSGMFPLIPYLLGEKHPAGRKICNIQKCVRTEDIDSVGNSFYHTFFEMMGHWSLGDYFKKEAIAITYDFLINKLNLNPHKISVTIFSGNSIAPFDSESKRAWLYAGVSEKRIFALPESENWWIAGNKGPCGPDSEVFVDTGKKPCGVNCMPSCKCGKYLEIWNNVFMEFNKKEDGSLEALKQRNVDVGVGVDRTATILENLEDNYLASHWKPLISSIENITCQKYSNNLKSFRVLSDHARSIIFLLAEDITPSNVQQGYIVRRIIRRAMREERKLKAEGKVISKLMELVINDYSKCYPNILSNRDKILSLFKEEAERFAKTLGRGTAFFAKNVKGYKKDGFISGKDAFNLYQSYGFPLELTEELATENNLAVNKDDFQKIFLSHKEESRTATRGFFKGGLSGDSDTETKYHTATHILHQALRDLLGGSIVQKGSNITTERLRFDFSFNRKISDDEIVKLEEVVNGVIEKNLPVESEIKDIAEARRSNALAFFDGKYGDKVKVYTIGSFSKEVCGGPHVASTGQLGRFKIIKEESAGAGIRRIKAILKGSSPHRLPV